ncbi:MAG: IS630 family transposase [Leptothrix ochracea]|uniref:IS630 family transposase n=2 Tax=Leptothrix ochracea TaxID=735331 RepID=UPI0034E25C18
MTKLDARHLSEENLQLLRTQAHRLRLDGRTWKDIALIVGVSLGAMMVWARRYQLGTEGFKPEAVASLHRGRMQGEHRTLCGDDEALLRQWIVQDRPDTHGLAYALWTRRAVQELIRAKFDLDMPIRTVGEYLMRWGMTPQRPARRAREQDEIALTAWTSETYPDIVRRAKAQGGTIYWADETAIRQDTAWIRGYAPSGQTPELLHWARWDSITMISAVTNQGLVRFRMHDGAIQSERFIDFLQGLIEDARSKVFLIVDNLRVHHAKQVRQWVEERQDRIELHYLPPYSPEANPDEWLNRDLKTELRLRPAVRDKTMLKAVAARFMDRLCSMPGRIKRYFLSASIRYAA